MIYVPRDATNDEVLDIIRTWVDILATGDYEAAFTAIISDAESETWTPYFLKIAVEGYRSPEFYPDTERFQVTDWRTAQGGNSEAIQEVTWYEPNTSGVAGSVEFDLPVNGQWSDLQAEFDVWEGSDLEEDFLLGLDEIGSWAQRQRRYEEEDRLMEEHSAKG